MGWTARGRSEIWMHGVVALCACMVFGCDMAVVAPDGSHADDAGEGDAATLDAATLDAATLDAGMVTDASEEEPPRVGRWFRTLEHNGAERTFIQFVPPSYTGAEPVPLLFVFHGYSQFAEDFVDSMRPTAISEGFIAVFPQGVRGPGGLTYWDVEGRWHVGGDSDDVGFVSAIIDTVAADYNVDMQRVYSSGFSNGGSMSVRLACELSERIAAIVSVGGPAPDALLTMCTPRYRMPMMQIHGTQDLIVRYEGEPFVRSVEDGVAWWAEHNGCGLDYTERMLPDVDPSDGKTVVRRDYDGCDATAAVRLFTVDAGSHTWPTAGCRDVDGAQLIWDFVRTYRR